MVRRDFSEEHCRLSLETSLGQLGLEAVDILLLHEPEADDLVDPGMEDCLQNWQQQGLIGAYGISGLREPTISLYSQRPRLAPHILQLEDDLIGQPLITHLPSSKQSPQMRGRFGRIRSSLLPIQQSFKAVPQLKRHWSDRLNLDLTDPSALVAVLLGAAIAKFPGDLLLFSSTDPYRLRRIVSLLQAPPWDTTQVIAFEHFWRPQADLISSPCL